MIKFLLCGVMLVALFWCGMMQTSGKLDQFDILGLFLGVAFVVTLVHDW